MRLRGVAILTVLVVTACAGATDGGVAGPAQSGSGYVPLQVDPGVLDDWRDFAVDQVPRPIVLLGEVARVEGFTTGEAKEAAGQSRFEFTGPLPAGPATATVTLPDGPADLPLIDAATALAALRTPAEPVPPSMVVPPLRITEVVAGTAEFATDRGPLTLPAWLFHVVDGLGPIAWPAVRPDEFWKLGQLGYPVVSGSAPGGGPALTVVMGAAPTDHCPGEPIVEYKAVAVESATAVVVGLESRLVGTAPGRPDPTCAHDLVYRTTSYQVTLAAPVDRRVVLDTEGNPVPIVIT